MAEYERVPTRPEDARDEPEEPELSTTNAYTATTLAEFNRPAPAWWKRFLLLFTMFFLGWLAVKLGSLGGERKPQVIYAQRYSDEHRYRPAASPVITEYLKDGRIRLRGASPGGVGVRPGDLPLTPQQKARAQEKKREEAKAAAKEKLKEDRIKRRDASKKRKESRRRRDEV